MHACMLGAPLSWKLVAPEEKNAEKFKKNYTYYMLAGMQRHSSAGSQLHLR